ncbi:MAG: hypothetical protein GYB67_01180 [Chloroflexi bacterium]|nr:hypothetical protein [Chloroflexota bacterium]
MNDQNSHDPSNNNREQPRRSPIRPTQGTTPSVPRQTQPARPARPAAPKPADPPTNPSTAMNTLRTKMEQIADEFAQGKINRAQFNAMYKRYSEQRTIIERLLERNPDTDAWRQVISVPGQTGFLRTHFQAEPLYYIIYRHSSDQPIISGGSEPADPAQILPALNKIWQTPNRPRVGLGRKPLPHEQWLVLAIGEHAATGVVFSKEPATAQARLVRDLHADFERANQAALARGWIVPERMVFPQRALVESGPSTR